MRLCSPTPHFFLLSLAVLFSWAAAAQVNFSAGDVVGNAGDVVEVPVYIATGGLAPVTSVLFINYDETQLQPFDQYYELRNLSGNTYMSAVRPEAIVTDSGKQVEVNTSNAGYISVGIFNLAPPFVTFPDGHLLTIAFRIRTGVEAPQGIVVDGDALSSTATNSDGVKLPLTWDDGTIGLGCTPPAAPMGLSASTNTAGSVSLQWSASSTPGAEYRVWRSLQLNLSTAVALGDGWQTTTTFQDVTAAAAQASTDCTKPDPIITSYYYWVQARNEQACVSEFSSPAQGSRSAAKSLAAAGVASGGTLICYGLVMLSLLLWRRRGAAHSEG